MTELQETTALDKIVAMKKRIRVVQGGTSAGKTYDILIDELDEAIRQPKILTTIMSDTMPNLRHGAMRDFINIAKETGVWYMSDWNSTYSTLTLPNESIIEFYSADSEDALGARRDRLFINEACEASDYTTPASELYTAYRNYCIGSSLKPIGKNRFISRLESLGYEPVVYAKVKYFKLKATEQ